MGCGGCHHLSAAGSTGEIGPDLDFVLSSHTAESLKAKITSPTPGTAMPEDFEKRMSAAELDALVELPAASRPLTLARRRAPSCAAVFEAIVFDNDGLLLDTEEAWTPRRDDPLCSPRERFTEAHKRALLGSSGAIAAGKLEDMLGLAGEGERLMDELHELVMEEALRGVPPRPGALELVDAVRAAGVPVGLASNSSREFVERVLSVAGMLDGHFDLIVTADEVEHPKPAPDLYLAACRGLSAAPARAAALEDSPPGVAAALAAGMFVIAVPYFADTPIVGASLQADSLADPRVAEALGVAGGNRSHPA